MMSSMIQGQCHIFGGYLMNGTMNAWLNLMTYFSASSALRIWPWQMRSFRACPLNTIQDLLQRYVSVAWPFTSCGACLPDEWTEAKPVCRQISQLPPISGILVARAHSKSSSSCGVSGGRPLHLCKAGTAATLCCA